MTDLQKLQFELAGLTADNLQDFYNIKLNRHGKPILRIDKKGNVIDHNCKESNGRIDLLEPDDKKLATIEAKNTAGFPIKEKHFIEEQLDIISKLDLIDDMDFRITVENWTDFLKERQRKLETMSDTEQHQQKNAVQQGKQKSLKVFISYSHDDEQHKQWVENFATKLKESGIDVVFDEWHLKLGQLLPNFMEQSVSNAEKVICILTPNYKKKANKLAGGVGYEYSIVTSEILKQVGTTKFIPLLKSGNDDDAIPISLGGRKYLDMRNDADFDEKIRKLLEDLDNSKTNDLFIKEKTIAKNSTGNTTPKFSLSDFGIERLKLWTEADSPQFYQVHFEGGGCVYGLGAQNQYEVKSGKEKAEWDDFFERLQELKFIDIKEYNKDGDPVYRLKKAAYDFIGAL